MSRGFSNTVRQLPQRRKYTMKLGKIPGNTLLFGLLLLWTACGKGPDPTDSATALSAELSVLLVGDPFALALEKLRPRLEEMLGQPVRLEIVGYNDGRRLTLLNAQDEVSAYDLVALDIVWLGEYARKGVLLDITRDFAAIRDRFFSTALEASTLNGRLLAMPIQPHPELLWVRLDLLAEIGRDIPKTTEEVLETARMLHAPAQQRYGIAWNAQRGQPLGQSMAHFFAAFGQPLLDGDGRPAFNTPRGLAAARYALALREVSPPDILNMAWDQRTSRFAAGQASMTYGWGARAYMAEDHPASRVRGQVVYTAAPHGPETAPVTPFGVWSLGIPANVSSPRRSLQLLNFLLSEEIQRELLKLGHGTPPLPSLARDPSLKPAFPVLNVMYDLDAAGELSFQMRPRIPEWDALCELLGTEFHDMLQGLRSPEETLGRVHSSALQLLGFSGETP